MNKKAQLFDEFNPAYLLLAIVGGLIGWFVASRASEGALLPIIAGLLSMAASYAYLVFTDQ